IFSGSTAAKAFKQIDRNKKFKRIFLIGSSHTMYFNGASIYAIGDFITPLGKVVVDTIARKLIDQYKFISNDPKPHETEHSLEVQLPFLQYWLNNEFTIVPIIIGGQSKELCRDLALALSPYFNEDNLFVISTDFSHYPDYQNAKVSDAKMADAILTNSSKEFFQTKNLVESGNTRNLVTAMCGWTSVLTLLYITENQPDICYKKIHYQNSGDSQYGDKQKVVGYYAIAAIKEKKTSVSGFQLSDEEKRELLGIARQTLNSYLTNNETIDLNSKKFSENLMAPAGAFVTLTLHDQLRGCIGNFTTDKPLCITVREMAIAAATQDPRFSPVVSGELPNLEIEISVLSPLKKISSPDEIVMGKHGIYIRKGNRSGTFLPQVATETGWSKEEFLGHCSRDKARIGWEGWKTAELFVYEALVFSEHEYRNNL
ncbi:MAG: AmmeMemoRadiSam system protein B, partial [Bacteroidales bacterium]|nr:AmmeMemoRadiSam system protein B [Bacteroidales bacterium]